MKRLCRIELGKPQFTPEGWYKSKEDEPVRLLTLPTGHHPTPEIIPSGLSGLSMALTSAVDVSPCSPPLLWGEPRRTWVGGRSSSPHPHLESGFASGRAHLSLCTISHAYLLSCRM